MVHNAIPFVHELLEKTVLKDDVVIDATCGNGNDTLFLANISKFVYGFDVQDVAIDHTERLLKDANLENYKLIQDSHEFIGKYVREKVKAITFNLGYLPGGDKTVRTDYSSTLIALKESLNLLVSGGIITLILYIGHPGGLEEANGLENYARSLNKSKYRSIKYDFINKDKSPYVIVIEKQ